MSSEKQMQRNERWLARIRNTIGTAEGRESSITHEVSTRYVIRSSIRLVSQQFLNETKTCDSQIEPHHVHQSFPSPEDASETGKRIYSETFRAKEKG